MFAKVFGQIFDSSIAEDYNCRRMFMDLLVLADSDGAVDMTPEAISRRTNVPLDQVQKYLKELSEPDPQSRSKKNDGRRIVPLDPNRNWGVLIVNYSHYREIRDEEARRGYFRDYQRERRAKSKGVKDKRLTKGDKSFQKFSPASAYASSSSSSLKKSKNNTLEEQIFAEYPRKVGRPKALMAIRGALRVCKGELLLERTRAYASAVAGSDPQFIPYPSTWFNQQRFNDPPEEWCRNNSTGAKVAKPLTEKEKEWIKKHGIA